MTWESIASVSTAAAVIVAIAALILENRRSRAINEIQILMELDKDFRTDRFLQKRNLVSSFLVKSQSAKPDVKAGDWDVVSDVLDFYQGLGTIVRYGHIRIELAYKFYFFWFSRYWEACRLYVEHFQSISPMTLKDASWLHAKLLTFDKRRNEGALGSPSPEVLREFFLWEMMSTCKDNGAGQQTHREPARAATKQKGKSEIQALQGPHHKPARSAD